ncbi:glycosyltransferase family 4 protein [bacterium]|nr:glycosyltransferase family 4 protein [bacterium]
MNQGPPPVLRVCHVIHNLGRGGAERLLVELADVAPGVGIDLSVVALMALPDDGYASDLRDRGVEVRSLGLASRWDPRASRRLAREMARIDPDLIHAHLKHADMTVSAVARRIGIPWVSTLHVIEDEVGLVGRLKRSLGARARTRASVTIAVSAALADWYRETYPRASSRLRVLENGVAEPLPVSEVDRSEIRSSLGVGPGKVMAITIAIMRPKKGHDDLLDASILLAPEVPVSFVLAGSGPEEERLRNRAARLDLPEGRVVFAGFREDVDDLLAAADMVVHPTHADALPTALIHALGAARPIIASDVGGVREVVGDDTGILVSPGDPAELADAVETLVDDPDARRWMGKAGRERFDELFDSRVWVSRLRSLYDDVLSRPTKTKEGHR